MKGLATVRKLLATGSPVNKPVSKKVDAGWIADRAVALQEAVARAPAVRFDSKHQIWKERAQRDSAAREGQFCLPLTRLPMRGCLAC